MSDSQVLSTFLTVESFMLAVLGLIATLAAPGRKRVPALPVKPHRLVLGVAILISMFASGALLAWAGLYVGGAWRPLRESAIAVILLVAVFAQPIVAVIVALGVRPRS